MRHKISAGISAPLLFGALTAVLAGCPTGTSFVENPNSPQVVAVYMLDDHPELNRGGPTFFSPQAPVQIFSTVDSAEKVSALAPPSYTALRIEFDQPLDATTVGDNAARTGTHALSFCTQGTAVTLKDVTNGNRVIASSTCYDPSSTVGSNPHITLTLGAATADPAATAFTCQAFINSGLDTANQNNSGFGGLLGANQYSLEFTGLKGSNGKALTLKPGVGATVSAGTMQFATSGVEVLAASYNDPSTGFPVILAKPSKGFLKDLAPDPAFKMLATSDPLLINFSSYLATDADVGAYPADAHNVAVPVTVTRVKDGSILPIYMDTFGDALGRTLEIFPVGGLGGGTCFAAAGLGCTGQWEPDVEYKVTIGANQAGQDQTGKFFTITAPTTFQFKTQSKASLGAVGVIPPPNQTAVRFDNPGLDNAGAARRSIDIQYPLPLDASLATNANVTLTETNGGAAVASDIRFLGVYDPNTLAPISTDSNGQIISIVPKAKLKPSTSYTVNVKNQKVKASFVEHGGQTVPDFTSQFTTVAFGISSVVERNALFSANVGNSSTSLRTHNIDRAATVTPFLLHDKALSIGMNSVPTNADTSNVKLQEVKADGTTTDIPIAVEQVAGTATNGIEDASVFTPTARIRIYASSATQPLKFATRYITRVLPTVTNDQGAHVSREGCTASATDDCSDFRTFTTGKFGMLLDVTDTAAGTLRIRFGHSDVTRAPDRINVYTYEADAATLRSLLPTAATDPTKASVKLFKQDPATGALTQVPATCAQPAADVDRVTCTPTGALAANSPYLWSVTFTTDAPVKVAANVTEHITNVLQGPNVTNAGATRTGPGGTKPTDQSTGLFAGAQTVAFTTACGP